MPRTFAVALPKDREPRFPNRCAVCLGAPTTRANVAHNNGSTSAVFWFRFLELFGEGSVAVPVCRRCWWRFRIQRFFRGSGLAVLAISVYFAVRYGVFDGKLDSSGERWLMLATGVFFGLPYLILELGYPRYFYSLIQGDQICYEFASRRYARWFQGLNGGRIHGS
jgi:hypothetical protein